MTPGVWIGLDVGTSWAKAAVWDMHGRRFGETRAPMPPVVDGYQDVMGVLTAAEEALRALPLSRARAIGKAHVAFTTQRDSHLGFDAEGAPLTPVRSWRAQWDHGSEQRAASQGPTQHRLENWLRTPWVQKRWAAVMAGWGVQDGEVFYAGGDKNCEYLALGVSPDAPGIAGLSMGSAIAMGVAVTQREGSEEIVPHALPSGVVASTGVAPSGDRVWHLETGVLSGMDGLTLALQAFGFPAWKGPLPRGDTTAPWGHQSLVCIPHFGGALDDLAAGPRFWLRSGGDEGPWVDFQPTPGDPLPVTAPQVARAWGEGVVAELARLRPRLEVAAGLRITEVRVAGGGVETADWDELLSKGLEVPVRVVSDPWLGCRGAVQIAGAVGLEAVV